MACQHCYALGFRAEKPTITAILLQGFRYLRIGQPVVLGDLKIVQSLLG